MAKSRMNLSQWPEPSEHFKRLKFKTGDNMTQTDDFPQIILPVCLPIKTTVMLYIFHTIMAEYEKSHVSCSLEIDDEK